MEVRPIGVIKSPFEEPEGMPIQPSGAAGIKGSVEVLPEYADGLQDLVVGAPQADSNGKAYVLFGPASGHGTLESAGITIDGGSYSDEVGYSVAGAGDVDADGYDDLLVGAELFNASTSWEGAVHLFVGPMSGEIHASDAEADLVGELQSDKVGADCAGPGDINGDGYDDMLAGAFGSARGGAGSGASYLVLGPARGTVDLASADAIMEGEETMDYACVLSGAGDVDDDGFADFLVGSGYNDRVAPESGAAYLLMGPVTGTIDLAYADAIFVGEQDNAQAGFAVSGAGDMDQDGQADFVVGSPYAQDNYQGRVYLFWGSGF